MDSPTTADRGDPHTGTCVSGTGSGRGLGPQTQLSSSELVTHGRSAGWGRFQQPCTPARGIAGDRHRPCPVPAATCAHGSPPAPGRARSHCRDPLGRRRKGEAFGRPPSSGLTRERMAPTVAGPLPWAVCWGRRGHPDWEPPLFSRSETCKLSPKGRARRGALEADGGGSAGRTSPPRAVGSARLGRRARHRGGLYLLLLLILT